MAHYSKTNRKRGIKKTYLIVGEGSREVFFLKYLQSLYLRKNLVHTEILDGKGGTADGIVDYAKRQIADYHKKIVVLDGDKKKIEMSEAEQKALDGRIDLIKNIPCLESFLLSILNNGKSFEDKKTGWCKQEFESKYLDKNNRQVIREFEKKFPKSLLNKQRKKISKLNRLIFFFEGKY